MYIYIIYIYIYIYICINFACLYMKMSNKNLYKKTFFYLKKTCTPDFTACYNQYADGVDIKSSYKVKRLRSFQKKMSDL